MKIKPMLGEFQLDGIEYVESAERRALVEHRVPGLAGSYFQDMGSAPNALLIVGTQAGDQDRDDFLTGIREIFNKGEPTTFVADINTATDLTDVVIQDLQVAEVGGESSTFRYSITLRRYVEPPEPVSTDLLDEGILDDALSVTDALDALDALGSIPSLGDPTPPLRDSLTGVQNATQGLPTVVDQVHALTQALPLEDVDTANILAPIVGEKGSDRGIAGVLGLLERVDSTELSSSLSTDLDQSVGEKLSIDTSALTGGSLSAFESAVAAIPRDPTSLTRPIHSQLESIQRLSGPELSQRLLGGLEGLSKIESLIPANRDALVESVASRFAHVKTEMIRGEFAEIVQWSDNVARLQAEVSPLLQGAGIEDGLLSYVRDRVDAIVEMILPDGDLVSGIATRIEASATADLPARLDTLKADLIARLEAARADFDSGNLTNTARLAEAETSFQKLADLLGEVTSRLRPVLDQEFLTPEGLSAKLHRQLDDFDRVEIVDLGNIRDKFASALRKIEETVRRIDLDAVGNEIEAVFAKVDGAIQEIDLGRFGSALADVKAKIEAALDAIDGALLEAVAGIRSVFTRIREAIRDVAASLGTYDAQGNFHYQIEQQIQDFLFGIKSSLRDMVQPLVDQLRQTVGQTLQRVQDAVQSVRGEIASVNDQLQGTLRGVHEQLQAVDVEGTMGSIRDGLEGMLDQLGTIDFDLVAGPVVSGIQEMRDSLKKIDVSKLNEFTIGALKVAVEVVVQLDFSTQVTAALMIEIDKLLEMPKNALASIEGKVEEAIREFGKLAPEALLSPLNDLFAPVSQRLNALELGALLEPLDAWHGRTMAQIDAVSPAALLQPVIDLYLSLEQSMKAVSPDALIESLQSAIDGIKADVRQIDVGSLADELTVAVDRIRELLNRASPAGLLTPVTSAFDKIMAAFDQFDPGALLEPFSELFEAVAGVLASLTAEGAKAIAIVFAALRSLVDAFDPRRVFALIRDHLAGVSAALQQSNLGGLLASLKAPFDSLEASLVAHGGAANLEVSARVDGLNPLRNAALGTAITEVQYLQSRLVAMNDAQPSTALVERYDKVRAVLEGLVPIWARENVSVASIRRAFEVVNPLNLKTEIDDLFGALKEKVRSLDPRLIQTRLQASFDKLQESLLGLGPELLSGAQKTISALGERLDRIDLQVFTAELGDLMDEIMRIVNGLDPRPIIVRLQGIVDELKAVVESLRPSLLLADLEAPLAATKAAIAEFDPATLSKPLQTIFEDVEGLLASIDVGVALQPLSERLQQLRDALEDALTRTEVAFNDMLKAIPV